MFLEENTQAVYDEEEVRDLLCQSMMVHFDFFEGAGYADHRKELSSARLSRGWSRPPPQTIGNGRLKLKIGA